MTIIRVNYRREDDGAWIGTSHDAPGYVGHGDTLKEAQERVQEGLPLFLDCGDVMLVHVAVDDVGTQACSVPARVRLGINQSERTARFSSEFAQALKA